jgi:hypothetical protein
VPVRRITALVLLASLALIAAGCGGSDNDTKTTKLTLDSKGRTLNFEDQPPKGPSPGDERAFTQGLITPAGDRAGRLDGSVVITEETGKGKNALEHRIGTVQYTLPGGSVVVSGVYTAKPEVFIPAAGVTRPIVGGTGNYKGASGEVTQTPTSNGEIRSVLDIEIPED